MTGLGSTTQIDVTVTPFTRTEKIVWKSSNENVAKVDENGTVTAIGSGKVTITVQNSSGNVKASINVTVTKEVSVTLPATSLSGNSLDSVIHPFYWSGEIEAGAKSVTINTTSQLINNNIFRSKIISFTYSGNGSHEWSHYLEKNLFDNNDVSQSSTEAIKLDGGTNWKIGVAIKSSRSI